MVEDMFKVKVRVSYLWFWGIFIIEVGDWLFVDVWVIIMVIMIIYVFFF